MAAADSPAPDGVESLRPVAIVGGTGALGFGLALRLAAAGQPVRIGSRDRNRAVEAATRIGDVLAACRPGPGAAATQPPAPASGHDNAGSVDGCELVCLCVPFRNQSETLTNLREALVPGQILIDATVPLAAAISGKATRMLGVWQGSAAQQAAEMAPEGVTVVSGLHTISAALLADVEHPLDEDVLLCGDRKADKEKVAALIGLIPGLRAVDCGKLESSRITESLTALLISINVRHKTHAGIRITGLPA